MCGLAGVWGQVDVPLVKSMMELVSHRGPDAEGMFVSPDGPGVLGHRRLSIMDPKGGDQPIYNETEARQYSACNPEAKLRSPEECHYHRLFLQSYENPETVLSNVARWADRPVWITNS
ncbi:MAG: hypothetical protein ABIK98_09615 [Pseudomonadota bacterium]|uniref:Glutamine amidotransferase type-2 domain-containing protein n=1 Tax=Candidatus Desulfatibia profunda TaxID=2841695 RepID=A0A8J6NLZ0_9BACT|nr:hypothetical protein [Candidatus Desulfatibia profunda]MBL7178936.1 hypothetical protein [Desulfobacterales bacterium]